MARAQDHELDLAAFEGVTARLLATPEDLADALAIIDEAEALAGAPLVDEAERDRLERAVADEAPLGLHHHAVLARREGACLGYAGLVLGLGPSHAHGSGDVAVQRGDVRCPDVLRALLAAVDELTARHGAHGTEVWIRHAQPADLLAAVASGYAVLRRLAVLGRDRQPEDDQPVAPPEGITIRCATPDDDAEVVALLAAAYADTPDGGWDLDRFARSASLPWFDRRDLLLAHDAHGLAGVHWTKRRDATTGEVHNLAVHPRAAGRGLGRVLLDAGLAHLAQSGCDEVLLWVDLANEAAIRLYVTAGFTTRWEDVALIRHTRGAAPTARR